MIDIKTKGWKSSEFILLMLSMVLLGGLVVAENALSWTVKSEIYTLLMALIGSKGVYAAGRAYYKGKKAAAIGTVLSGGGGEKLLSVLKGLVNPPPKKHK